MEIRIFFFLRTLQLFVLYLVTYMFMLQEKYFCVGITNFCIFINLLAVWEWIFPTSSFIFIAIISWVSSIFKNSFLNIIFTKIGASAIQSWLSWKERENKRKWKQCNFAAFVSRIGSNDALTYFWEIFFILIFKADLLVRQFIKKKYNCKIVERKKWDENFHFHFLLW